MDASVKMPSSRQINWGMFVRVGIVVALVLALVGYAVAYHRKRRELRDFTSELSAIPGVGEKRKTRLLRHFGSINRISEASVEELSPFVGRKTAGEIAEHFARQRALAEEASAA